MNVICMTGRLTKEPELRRTQQGTAVCSFSLAVKRPRVKDTTDFHDCVVWQQGAEYLCQYGHKGDLVVVNGALTTREWTDNNSNKRKATEVTCDSVELISAKRDSQQGNQPNQQPTNAYPQGQQAQIQGCNGGYRQDYPGHQQQYPQIDVPDAQLPF
jgi:single-strand DNA-binding protein